MEINKIWNESNEITMSEHIDEHSVDLVLTSPPYNNSRDNRERSKTCKSSNRGQYKDSNGHDIGIGGYHKKYDVYRDALSTEEYCNWIVSIFNLFDKVLKKDGVVLWNISSQAENNECANWMSVFSIVKETNFTIADRIIWKKNNTLPVTSRNKLSKICEDIFVFARKDEFLTFYTNKEYKSTSKTGQNFYKPIRNWIEADNNDEICPYNKATFSTDLCYKLFKIYAPENGLVYDPFMGSGTTALAAKNYGLDYIGSEISPNQVEWAENRIKLGKGFVTNDKDKYGLF